MVLNLHPLISWDLEKMLKKYFIQSFFCFGNGLGQNCYGELWWQIWQTLYCKLKINRSVFFIALLFPSKLINAQSLISPHRNDFFLEINKRTCSFIRKLKVSSHFDKVSQRSDEIFLLMLQICSSYFGDMIKVIDFRSILYILIFWKGAN